MPERTFTFWITQRFLWCKEHGLYLKHDSLATCVTTLTSEKGLTIGNEALNYIQHCSLVHRSFEIIVYSNRCNWAS